MTLFQTHYSDEALIAHLDGELPFYRERRVKRHLENCWQCRLRLSEIEVQILGVTRAVEEDTFPGPERISQARLEFLQNADAVARQVSRTKAASTPVSGFRLRWAAACLLLAGVFSICMYLRQVRAIPAVEAIRRVRVQEAESAALPAHQDFRVVSRQLRPQPVKRESRLEVWSEPNRGRFASRFSDDAGVLKHAIWQPQPERQFVYNASRASTVVRVSRQEAREAWDGILFRDGLTLEDLEAGLFTWLENRPWRPVSFTSGIALMSASDGTTLSAEEARSASGQQVLRLRARRTRGPVTVEFTVEVDRRTYTPQLQSIRYESPARTLELQLYTRPAAFTETVSFEPPSVGSEPLAPAPALTSHEPVPALPRDPTLTEIEIYYALHRVRGCIGETIDVERGAGGRFNIRGVVVNSERKEQVIEAVGSIRSPGIAVDIRSVQEALRDMESGTAIPDRQPAGAPAQYPKRLPEPLLRFFSGNGVEAEEFVEKVALDGESLMKDAQALRQLAERFGGRIDPVSRQGRWLLEVMAYDHLRDLRARVESANQRISPVLARENVAPTPRGDAVLSADDRWDRELLRIFSQSRNLNECLRKLSIGGGAANDDRVFRDIADALRPLQSSVQTAFDRAVATHSATRPF